MSIIRCLFLLVFFLPLFASLGFTQERLKETLTPKASSARPNEVPADITSTIELDVRVTQETALGPKPAAVSFVVERSSDGMMKGVGNVRLHGYTRYVEQDGKRTGQVIITDVSREGKKVYLKGGGLTGNFNIPASANAGDATTQGTGVQVTPKTTITVHGDRNMLVNAVQEFEAASGKAQKATEEEGALAQIISAGNEGGVISGKSGSGSGTNKESAYKTPEAAKTKKEPVLNVKVTTDGCSVKIDYAQGVAIKQTKTQTFKDGILSEESECTNSFDRYTLKKSYSVCSTKVNVKNLKAVPQFLWYYNDAGGARHDVGTCQVDTDTTFPIVERADGCAVKMNFTAMRATPQTRLVYTDQNNAEHQVRGCQPSTERKSVALTTTTDGCSGATNNTGTEQYERTIYSVGGVVHEASACAPSGVTTTTTTEGCDVRVDLVNLRAIVQQRTVKRDKGSVTDAGQCVDSPTTYALIKSYEGCEDKVSLTTGSAQGTSKYIYMKDGAAVEASACTPDKEQAFRLVEETGDCQPRIDTAQHKVTPQSRLVYENRTRQRVVVRECEPSKTKAVIAMSHTTDGCMAQVQDTGLTVEHKRWVYDWNGKTMEGVACMPTGLAWRDTYEGCESKPVRVDIPSGVAVKQWRRETFKNGALKDSGRCADSPTHYALHKGYADCTIDIDLDSTVRMATGRYRWYYTDEAGETQNVSKCTPDEERQFAIREDHKRCAVNVDYNKMQVTPQAAFVYTDQNNRIIEVRGCDDSETKKPVKLIEKTAGCSLRHDYATGESHRMSMFLFTLDNIVHQASSCADNGETFTHETVYVNANKEYICPSIVDRDARHVTLQSRQRISVDGQYQYISECTPDAAGQVAIQATTDGCMDPAQWKHDLASNQSFGQERFYWENAKGQKLYTSQCQNSDVVYAHAHKITGYQYKDDHLHAYPLMDISIQGPSGDHLIAKSRLLPGATQLPYVLAETKDIPNGKSTYEGCDAYGQTDRSEHWKRPDDSFYIKPVGDGKPVRLNEKCTTENDITWKLSGNIIRYVKSERLQGVRKLWFHHCTLRLIADYTGTRRTINGAGEIVNRDIQTKEYQIDELQLDRWHQRDPSCNFHRYPSKTTSVKLGNNNIVVPQTVTGEIVNTWIIELGWNK